MVVFGEVIASSFIGHDESPILLAAYSFSEASMSWDGTNNVVRIPKEVSDFLDINEKNRKNKRMKFEIIEKNEQLTQIITIIDHEKK
jgi:cytochrome c2